MVLSEKWETLKVLEAHIDRVVRDTSAGKEFLNRTPCTQGLRPTIHKWDFIKLRRSHTVKKTLKRGPIEIDIS